MEKERKKREAANGQLIVKRGLSDEEKEKIIELYDRGASRRHIEGYPGITASYQTICRVIQQHKTV